MAEGRADHLELRGGSRVDGDEFIVAVPFFQLLSLLPPPLRDDPAVSQVAQLESSPISSVHLWFDRPITALPHAVFVDRLSQWLFNRTALWNVQQPAEWCYQIVISASRAVREQPHQATIAAVVGELRAIWPAAAQAALLRARVVTEQRAVFSPLPGVERHRPPQQSPLANLQFAGDWTRTGWPATMEGAVRSGYLAAENVLARRGLPSGLLQPDLPVAPLSRLLLGLRSETRRR